jgi:hypothetical protein
MVSSRGQKQNAQRGIGLVMAMLILFLLSLLGGALLTASTIDLWIGENYQRAVQLLYLTESGIEDGRDALRDSTIEVSEIPFIDRRPLLDSTGREVGRYSVSLTRAIPLTLRSVGTIGNTRKTIEVRLEKSGFPNLSEGLTLAENILEDTRFDVRLKTTAGLERLVEGILRNATDIYRPVFGVPSSPSYAGSPNDYRVVVVDGDCVFADTAGYGLLLVRGDLIVHGNFTWDGLVLVIGQGTLRAPGYATGWINGAAFIARTRDADRTSDNPLGTVLDSVGSAIVDLGDNTLSVERNAEEFGRANARFPYVPVSYREF